MKHYILLLIMFPFVAQGQTTEPDTITVKELGEITVVADAQRTSATKTVYIPTANQKLTASDGVSLLLRMNIPQLSVNPIAETVKTADNQGVSLFINFHPATDGDVSGLNPNDVKRVEYLDFPTDPRFQRAQHVVNFITHSYTYGGYTKLSGKERFMIRRGEALMYSKFAYRKIEYDLMVSGDYDYNSHIGSVSDETYRLESGTIKRESGTETGHKHQRSLYSALRASWNRSTNFTFRNLVSFRRINTPINRTSGYVNFSSQYPSETFYAESPSTNNAISWDSELYAALGRGWAINGNFQTEFAKNNTTSNYAAGAESIENFADEGSWFLRGTMQVNKSLSDRFTLFSSISSGGGCTKIDYGGSSNAVNRFRQTFTGITVGMSLNFRKVSGSIDRGYAFESNYINDKTMDDRYPFTHVNVQYAPNQKHSVNLWFQYATFSPDVTMRNPNIIQQSELMYVSGNPDLKCSRNTSAALSYTWLPCNKWQFSAYATVFRIANRQIAVYTPDAPDGMMLKKYRNDGDYNHGQLGASLTGKFFEGRLSISVSPRLLLYNTTGSNSISHYPFMTSLNVNYSLGKFFFNAYYDSRNSYVDGENAYLRKMTNSYSLSAGWTAQNWNLQLSIINPFQSSWGISKDTLTTSWYDSNVTQLGSDYHRRISLTVTYTFNYGKKVNQSGELSGKKNVSSSILH
ncbi:outer membrane beta-barrel protein [Bacteroides acidifaciens]|uniref:outer membrane beta-barrel protein n=2 Tax=Bacteroides TaxID=816 RepID=UPI00258B096B|nr:outer membrane beta-barrel protein [Bacteroides acidifaciens]